MCLNPNPLCFRKSHFPQPAQKKPKHKPSHKNQEYNADKSHFSHTKSKLLERFSNFTYSLIFFLSSSIILREQLADQRVPLPCLGYNIQLQSQKQTGKGATVHRGHLEESTERGKTLGTTQKSQQAEHLLALSCYSTAEKTAIHGNKTAKWRAWNSHQCPSSTFKII